MCFRLIIIIRISFPANIYIYSTALLLNYRGFKSARKLDIMNRKNVKAL